MGINFGQSDDQQKNHKDFVIGSWFKPTNNLIREKWHLRKGNEKTKVELSCLNVNHWIEFTISIKGQDSLSQLTWINYLE